VSEKRLRIAPRLPKSGPAYWRKRLFKNAYAYKGIRGEVASWSVKIQLFGKRKSFTLRSEDRAQAASEACQIYQSLLQHGWKLVARSRARTGLVSRVPSTALISSASVRYDVEYWKRRLIHRRYPEPALSPRTREFSVRIEHAHTSYYFPLGTSDEGEAANRAMRIYRTVVNQGWAIANAHFPRELSAALRWQDTPLTWTYTTVHTRQCNGPLKPIADPARRPPEKCVVFIEPDEGIRFALAECANSQEGFRCDSTFAGAAEAVRALPRRRVDLALVNHDVPDETGLACLEELQSARPGLAVVAYSVFEDTDQLFKATPGGAVFYMLKRTSTDRIFEPIADLAGPATREQIASDIGKYFQRLSALLPSGPPFWKLAKLTPREHEILAFLSKGDLIKEIADRLGISNWTVHGHVKRIFEKLNVHSRTEAVIKYLQK